MLAALPHPNLQAICSVNCCATSHAYTVWAGHKIKFILPGRMRKCVSATAKPTAKLAKMTGHAVLPEHQSQRNCGFHVSELVTNALAGPAAEGHERKI